MAKLPTAQEVYGTRKTPRGDNTILGYSTAAAQDMAATAGSGLKSAGKAISDVGNVLEDMQEKADRLSYMEKISNFQLENDKELVRLGETSFEDGVNIQNEYVKSFQERAEKFRGNVPRSMQDKFQEDFLRMRGNFAGAGLIDNVNRVAGKAKVSFDNLVTNHENIVMNNPDEAGRSLAEIKSSLDNFGGIPQKDKQKMLDNALDKVNYSAALSRAESNPYQFIKDVKSGKYNDVVNLGGLRNRADGLIKKREAKAKSERNFIVGQTIKDATAEARATGESSVALPDRDVLIDMYGEVRADNIETQYEENLKFGKAAKAIETATPEEVNNILSDFTPSGENFANEAQNYAILISAVSKRNSAINSDSALYVSQVSESVRTATELYNENPTPENLQFLIENSINEQKNLGVKNYDLNVLTNDNTSNIISKIDTLTTDEKIKEFNNLKSMYGYHYNKVYTELVDGGMSDNIAVAMRLDDTRVASSVLQADENKKDIEKNLDSGTIKSIKSKVRAKLNSFSNSLLVVGDGVSELNRTASSVNSLASLYVFNGDSVDTAVSKAYKGIVGNNYNITKESVRVPVKYNDNLISIGLSEFRENRINTYHNIVLPPNTRSISGLTEEEMTDIYRAEVGDSLKFVTNNKEDGVYVYDKQGNNLYEDKDGVVVPVVLMFKDIEVFGSFGRAKALEQQKATRSKY